VIAPSKFRRTVLRQCSLLAEAFRRTLQVGAQKLWYWLIFYGVILLLLLELCCGSPILSHRACVFLGPRRFPYMSGQRYEELPKHKSVMKN
jgi:hypothetical protein